jgi:hypothetical protein
MRLAAARAAPPALALNTTVSTASLALASPSAASASVMSAEQQAAWRAQQVARARGSLQQQPPLGASASSASLQMGASAREALLAKARAAGSVSASVPMTTSLSTASLPAWQQQFFAAPTGASALSPAPQTQQQPRMSMSRSGRLATPSSAGKPSQ